MGEESTTAMLRITGVIAQYWVVSISLVYINKFILSEQSAPIFITWSQCIVTCVICWVCGALGEKMRGAQSGATREKVEEGGQAAGKPAPDSSFLAGFPKARYDRDAALKVMPLSMIFVLMILSNQLTLKYVEVSFYNVARSLTIVFNAIFSVMILGSVISCRTIACLAVVITGFIVGCEGEVQLSVLGVQWGLISSVSVSLNSIYTKKALPHVMNDAWRLTFINNANACLLFIPFVVYFEGGMLREQASSGTLFSRPIVMGLVVSGILGFLMGIVTVMQIRVTSPLTHNISGTAKAGVQSILAFYIWDNEATFLACVGIFLVLFGSSLYTYVKITEVQKGPAKVEGGKPLLPK
ncbi:unnamed protein product [Ectocarpus fasciculatus]